MENFDENPTPVASLDFYGIQNTEVFISRNQTYTQQDRFYNFLILQLCNTYVIIDYCCQNDEIENSYIITDYTLTPTITPALLLY